VSQQRLKEQRSMPSLSPAAERPQPSQKVNLLFNTDQFVLALSVEHKPRIP